MKKPQNISSYEERLRASLKKLIVPDWYNHQYTETNGLRKTKSHGHVPRNKRPINTHDDTPEQSITSPCFSNNTHRQSYRYRSPSRSWSERAPPLRHDSTTSSYDTNGSIINGRRSTTSNGSSSSAYTPGLQRVAESSSWYKPRSFTTNGHTNEPPKPLPRHSKIDQERIYSLDSTSSYSSSPSSAAPLLLKNENVRHPIKPRTMAQAQFPSEQTNLDVTLTEQSADTQPTETSLPRTNSLRSVSSDAESYRSAVLPPTDKNLVATDSSSYASVNDRCLSPSTASYHTAIAGDTSSSASSITGYETPTPQFDDDNTLSTHSSLSDLSHAETLEPNTEDLDIVAVSTAEQKSISGMENASALPRHNTTDNSTKINQTRSLENTNWYDGSIETFIHQPSSSSSEIREIPTDEILRETDINAVGDEFFLISPRSTNDELSTDSTNNPDQSIESPSQTSSKLIFTIEEKSFDIDDNNHSSLMITNLDDILIDDNDNSDYSPNHLLNRSNRRPIQEDILYEVEHENSYSDHSQNTSSIIPLDGKTSIKTDANIDYLTSIDSPIRNEEKQPSPSTNDNNNNIIPIYILPPLYTTRPLTYIPDEPSPTTLHIDTNNNFHKWDTFIHQYSDLSSPTSYTPKIRHRHYSVGSYYDHKNNSIPLHSNTNPLYYLGSAPVSPLNRASVTNHHSPRLYDNISTRRVNAIFQLNTNEHIQSTEYHSSSSSSVNREERTRVITYISPKITSKSVERTIPITQMESTSTIPKPISPPTTRTSSVAFPQYEIPTIRPRVPPTSSVPPLPPRFSQMEQTQISFEKKPVEKKISQHIYQEIDSVDDDQVETPTADLQFIRGAIERVFHFNGQSTTDTTSESSIYEEVDDNNTTTTTTTQAKKSSSQYPAVQAVQRFYNQKSSSNIEPKHSNDQITNLDDIMISKSSTSKQSPKHQSPPIITRKKDRTKSSEHVSSEEIDDTLNDIEDVDYPDEKLKRQTLNTNSTHTSSENSPVDSLNTQSTTTKTSQHTQTIGLQKPSIRSTVPAIDIVTDMVIEGNEDDDDIINYSNGNRIEDVDGDMVIYYDDIEIVEHLTSSCSSETDSSSSTSHHYSKPLNISINEQQPPPPPPPPVPARTLKPSHLLNNNDSSSSITNKTYELEKTTIRKKFDVNTVNDMINRTDYNLGPTSSHRHPSARHFVGKLNSDDSPIPTTTVTNGHKTLPMKSSSNTLPSEKPRSIIADTNALVKQIQNSLSRNSLHDTQVNTKTLSTSTKELRSFVSTTYSPTEENTMDDNGTVHKRQQQQTNNPDDRLFKRQARLSKSFHNVSEYSNNNNNTDQYQKKDNPTQPSKSVENNLDQYPQKQPRQTHIPLNLTSVVTSTSYSALTNSEDHARMLSMKWYTGQVSENSEICYNPHQHPADDLLHGYISTHSSPETQAILARLQASNDPRINAALDDIRSRVTQFDASKTRDDLYTFMRYLESRLRDLNNKQSSNIHQESDTLTSKRQTNAIPIDNHPPLSARQLGRQHLRSTGSNNIENTTNTHQPTPPRRASQSSANQENAAVFDDMLNTVLGLPKKGVSALPENYPQKREKPITTTTSTGRDTGRRLFESGTYKDPRLLYDGAKRKEKEEDEPLETSV